MSLKGRGALVTGVSRNLGQAASVLMLESIGNFYSSDQNSNGEGGGA